MAGVCYSQVAAMEAAQNYLLHLVGDVKQRLRDTHVFFDPIERSVEREFMPWLESEVSLRLRAVDISHQLTDGIFHIVYNSLIQFLFLFELL